MSARDVIREALIIGGPSSPTTKTDLVLEALTAAGYRLIGPAKFDIGQRVTKIKGSSWTGKVVGFYSTSLTPDGYAVESENEPGSVQIYPEVALRSLQGGEDA